MRKAMMTLLFQEGKHRGSCRRPTAVMLTYSTREESLKEMTFPLWLAFGFLFVEIPLALPQGILYLPIFYGPFSVDRYHKLIT